MRKMFLLIVLLIVSGMAYAQTMPFKQPLNCNNIPNDCANPSPVSCSYLTQCQTDYTTMLTSQQAAVTAQTAVMNDNVQYQLFINSGTLTTNQANYSTNKSNQSQPVPTPTGT